MKLTRVTITGVDDATDPRELVALGKEFPFVEWGILGSLKRTGEPRYPSADWLRVLHEVCGGELRSSRHLCGELARRSQGEQPSLLSGYTIGQRVQVNGFPSDDLFAKHERKAWLERIAGFDQEIILQCRSRVHLDIAAMCARYASNVVALFDASGGRGIVPDEWPAAPAGLAGRLGYAGGIGPDNVTSVVETLSAFPSDDPFWIDMESGVRTDDRFDLAKVRRVLELTAPIVQQEAA